MFGTSDSWFSQQHSTLESSGFKNCMIAPVEIRQHEFLPASVNPCRVSVTSGFNEFGPSGWPGRGLMSEGSGLIGNLMPYSQSTLAPNGCNEEHIPLFPPRETEQPWAIEAPCPQQRKFLVFDQSGNETRLMFSSACPQVQKLQPAQTASPFSNLQAVSAQPFDGYNFFAERQAWKVEQACTKTPIMYEESGENKIVGEGSELREDTEEINALLYSDDDDDCDNSCGEDDDEVSSGHSPLDRLRVWQSQEEQKEIGSDNDVASSSTSLKRRKVLDSAHEKPALKDTTASEMQNLVYQNIHEGDLICALDEGLTPNVGSKRSRKDKIRDTLKVLESIIPGVKNKDPVAILEEAISYLKCLKSNAEMISAEDSETSGCYEPPN